MKYALLAIDLQNDFTTKGGEHYIKRPCVDFLKKNIFPFLKEKNVKINEIISDYRPPRPGDRGTGCVPGTWGYESIVPEEIVKSQWIKCMNSPIWIRENIGDAKKEAGLPYQDTKAFDGWLNKEIGKPDEIVPVLFGLTIDCCVLSTLQELSWRGYYPKVLYEGSDHYKATKEAKNMVIVSALTNWGDVIHWEKLKDNL